MTETEIKLYGSPANNRKDCNTSGSHRKCPKCGNWKAHSEFPPRKDVVVGISNICRECSRLAENTTKRKRRKARKRKIEAEHGRMVKGSWTVTETEKQCPTCKEWKLHDQFCKSPNTSHGLGGACKTCRYWYGLLQRYGVTKVKYFEMLKAQNGQCAICKVEHARLYVDHDHKTDKVRGLLCEQCNFLLGNAKDNVNTLVSAIQYLEPQREDS
jgi:hypothetical protein